MTDEEVKNAALNKLLSLLDEGSKEYEKDVVAMSDRQLYFHVFNDDYHPDDFASKELKKRGIEQYYPCPQCQGGGCPYCSGQGEIPTFE